MPYIPHTEEDIKLMLQSIGVEKTDNLFDEIPSSLLSHVKNIPAGLNEMEMLKEARQLANQNNHGICFLGAGSYEHHIPAAVWDIASRGEFLTSYTPYQAEASQGTLQLLYEFQTMIAELTGLEVANASLYDGASALAEAVLMSIRINKKNQTRRVLILGTVNPFYRETLETIVRTQHIEIITLNFDEQLGITPLEALETYKNEEITALVIQQPNFFGCLEEVDELVEWAKKKDVITIASVNPISLGLLKSPGEWGNFGVDIACGEGQPLGVPMASGGPYFGFMSTKMEYVRQLPGRLIGQTTDKAGNVGFTLTLQAREQHIRRGKATSNICTNQGLLVTAGTIYMSLLGPQGLRQVASHCHDNTQKLVDSLTQIEGVDLYFTASRFHEALLKIDHCPDKVLSELLEQGILGGYSVQSQFPSLKGGLLVCATELRSDQEINHYFETLQSIMNKRE